MGCCNQPKPSLLCPRGLRAPTRPRRWWYPNGKFVYGSNRGHDSIVRFGVNQTSGQLTLLGHTPTGGNTPRHFSISPSGRWLLVANQDSDEIVVFEINIATGELTLSSQVPTVAGPKFVGFWGPL